MAVVGRSIEPEQRFGTTIATRAAVLALACFLGLRLLGTLVPLIGLILPSETQPDGSYELSRLTALEAQSPASRYLLAPWYRFDTVHYVQIAEEGYTTGAVNVNWPPFYPGLIWLAGRVITPALLAGLVVSNLAALLTFYLLYRLAAEVWDEGVARQSVIWLAVFPTGFFLIAGYTESLCLALSLGCLLAVRRGRWLLAGLLGAAAALTRYQGVLLALPMAWEGLMAFRATRERRPARLLAIFAPIALIPLALAGYSLYVHLGLGLSWPWEAVTGGFAQRFGFPGEGLWGSTRALISRLSQTGVFDYPRLTDLAAMLLAIFLLLRYRTRMPFSYWIYSVALILLFMSKVSLDAMLVSTGRYLLTAFPVFAALSLWIRGRWARLAWFGISLGGQAVLLASFYWGAFVG